MGEQLDFLPPFKAANDPLLATLKRLKSLGCIY